MKFLMMTFAAVISALLLSACVSNDDPYFKTKIVSFSQVSGCRLIGSISSSSQNYGLFKGTAEDHRLQNAKRSGYNLGATHIVLEPAREEGNTTVTDGKAYACPN